MPKPNKTYDQKKIKTQIKRLGSYPAESSRCWLSEEILKDKIFLGSIEL